MAQALLADPWSGAREERELTVVDFQRVCAAIRLNDGSVFVPEDWQLEIVEDLLTPVPELHVWIPEANGKTTFAAAIAIFRLLTRRRPNVILVAASEQQARSTLYNQAVGMIDSSPELAALLVVKSGTLEIRVVGASPDVGLKAIAANALRAHGIIPTDVFVEEMHAHPGLGMYRTVAGKLQKIAGAQLVSISTAGEPDSEFELMRQGVLEGPGVTKQGPRVTRAATDEYIAWNYALTGEDDVHDCAIVKLANPLESITVESLERKHNAAGFEEKHWRTFVCNLPTRDFVSRFLPEEEWAKAVIQGRLRAGVRVQWGIDWGWKDDATVCVPIWRHDAFWVLGAATVIEPPRNGTQLDPEVVKAKLLELSGVNPVDLIAHDSGSYGGGHLMSAWLSQTFPQAVIVEVTPAVAVDAGAAFLERLRAGELRHLGDETLTRHLLNATREPVQGDPERFRVKRPKESRHAPHQRAQREIDAAIAAINAVWGAVIDGDPDPFFMVI